MVLRLHFLSIGHSAGSPIRVFTAIAGKSFQIPYTTPNGDSIGPFFFFKLIRSNSKETIPKTQESEIRF